MTASTATCSGWTRTHIQAAEIQDHQTDRVGPPESESRKRLAHRDVVVRLRSQTECSAFLLRQFFCIRRIDRVYALLVNLGRDQDQVLLVVQLPVLTVSFGFLACGAVLLGDVVPVVALLAGVGGLELREGVVTVLLLRFSIPLDFGVPLR